MRDWCDGWRLDVFRIMADLGKAPPDSIAPQTENDDYREGALENCQSLNTGGGFLELPPTVRTEKKTGLPRSTISHAILSISRDSVQRRVPG